MKSKDPSLPGVYHRECFVCGHDGCTALLLKSSGGGGEHFVFRNKPFCARHYHEQAGTLCLECDKGVEGAARFTEGGVYHLTCLVCQFTPDMIGQRAGFNRKCAAVSLSLCSLNANHWRLIIFLLQALETFYDVNGKHLCEQHYLAVSNHAVLLAEKPLQAEKRVSVLRPLKY